MPSLTLVAIVAAVLAGLGVKFVLDKTDNRYEITRKEFFVGTLIIALLVAPASTFAGWSVAKADKLSFNEYWNGYETAANWQSVPCSRDGPCVQNYNCDPYEVWVPPTYDDKGNQTGGGYFETHYHSCPYTTEEWIFTIDTTLGSYLIADHIFPTNPQSHLYRANVVAPTDVPSGIPPFWAAAKQRIDNGKPGPVTKRMQYDNYLLASDQTILKQYSDKIKQFNDAKLLPKVSSTIRDFYYADKVYFVGYTPADKTAWQNALMYLDAGLGTELQGDLHLVITQNEMINREPDAYITALKAYWSDPVMFEDNALSKNAIVVVVGTTDGKTIAWARAITGMPLGNEYMLNQIQVRLVGAALNPETIIGAVNGELYTVTKSNGETKIKARALHDGGILERVVWGLDDPATKFKRVSMTARDSGDNGSGFLYLADEIRPSDGQQTAIVIVTFFLCMFVWLGFAVYGKRYDSNSQYSWR